MTQPYFFIRTDRRYIRINYNEVHYFESAGNYVKVYTGSATHLAVLTIRELEKILPRHLFSRINRGTIVAIHAIVSFDSEQVILKNTWFSFSGNYREELKTRITLIKPEEKKLQRKKVMETERHL